MDMSQAHSLTPFDEGAKPEIRGEIPLFSYPQKCGALLRWPAMRWARKRPQTLAIKGFG
jgi:hypothetical protein